MIDEKRIAEIVKELRGTCPSDGKGTCRMCWDAAGLVESLQAQLYAAIAGQETLQRSLAESRRKEPVVSTIPCCECGGKVVEFTVPNDIWNFVMRPDGKETNKEYICLNCWYKALRIKLEESQRREKAAVEDMRGVCILCEKCTDCLKGRRTVSTCVNTHCKNWQWRGPEAGKGADNGKV